MTLAIEQTPEQPKPWDGKVQPRMIKARSKMITSQPFFGTLALHLEIIERDDLPTMATDGRSLFYNKDFLAKITDEEAEFVIAHEAYHCACLHHTRRQNRDPFIWNVACDYVVNADLVKAGFKAPQGALLDSQYDGLSSEDVYAIIMKKAKEGGGGEGDKDGKGKRVPGGGNGGGKPDFSKCGEILDAAKNAAGKAEQEAEWKTITKQ